MTSDLDLANKHRYRTTPGGRPAPSVTQITGCWDDGKSGALAGSAAKITRAGRDYRAEWRDKRDIGTRVHDMISTLISGGEVEPLAADEPYLDAFEDFINECKPEWLHTERVVLCEHIGYGGRFDAIARLGERTWLLDFKTGKPYPFEQAMQLAAYVNSDGMAIYAPDGALLGTEPMPPIDETGCLFLRDDGGWDLLKLPGLEPWVWLAFQSLLDAWYCAQQFKQSFKGEAA